jgi:enoyl-CoA hydratase/carnithine racemase
MGIEYTKDGPVATFTLANGKVNPITPAMHREMAAAMADFLADPELRVGILTGAGERAFSAGDDLKSEDPTSGSAVEDLLGAMGPGPARPGDPEPPGYDPADAILRMARTKPVIGAVRGCTPDARFGLPEIAYGMGGIGGTMQLARHIPAAAAYELALTGEPVGADEAARLGMVNRVVAPDVLMDEARRLAGLIARHPPLAVRTEMESMRRAADLDPDDSYVFGMTLYHQQRMAMGESDVQETFLYKR